MPTYNRPSPSLPPPPLRPLNSQQPHFHSLSSSFFLSLKLTMIHLSLQAALEATRAVFKFLNDPDASGPFLAKAFEASARETKEAGGGGGPSTGVGIPPSSPSPLPVWPGMGSSETSSPSKSSTAQGVRFDCIIRLYMQEYQSRLERNTAHIAALFRGADSDRDGQVCFEEFVQMTRHMKPDASERFIARMFAEAQSHLERGRYLISLEIFTKVAHTFGLGESQSFNLPLSSISPDTNI